MENATVSEYDQLNALTTDIKDYFRQFIRNKNIEELISHDNKLFAEIRNLENEKHILVTQNYKKFVAATETINTIKSSLVGFEKDLYSLQGKVQNLVQNFNIVNSSVESKLEETENIYKVKKDLKRLKFINDLPNVLENQLSDYLNAETRNIKTLEKSLIYYEKCKEFLKLHKDNSLVKDIYSRTNNLITKYRSLISDELHMPDFNEFSLDLFELCLSLLVKLEDDNSELILTFIDRFKFLIVKKFDELFSLKESVNEIDFHVYMKIYDNYEFAINENEFLFYESQILELKELNQEVGGKAQLTIKNLQSKYFKKGSFIWICKKIQEVIIQQYVSKFYELFTNLFIKSQGHQHENHLITPGLGLNSAQTNTNTNNTSRLTQHLNLLFIHIIEVFNKKVKDLIYKSHLKIENNIDPIFFKEGLTSFYYPFCEVMQKLNDENLNSKSFESSVLENNTKLTEIYLSNLHSKFIIKVCETISNGVINVREGINSNTNQFEDTKSYHSANFNKIKLNNEAMLTFNKVTHILVDFIAQVKKLDLADLYNLSNQEEVNKIYYDNVVAFINLFSYILKSQNLKFQNLIPSGSYFSDSKFDEIRHQIKQLLPNNKQTLFFMITLAKGPNTNTGGLKTFVDKICKEIPQMKNNKTNMSDFRNYIDKELTDSLVNLFDSIVQIMESECQNKLKELFFDVDFTAYENAIAIRLELKELVYELFHLKNELYELLDEEKKAFMEAKASTFDINMKKTGFMKKPTKFHKELEMTHIRRLNIYNFNNESPQTIMLTIAKIFFKVISIF
jgi:hypothetical protein